MKTSIDPNDHQFLERLHRLGAGTVQEICAELQVTATAVRQRLVRLQGLGLVSREVVRTGRGRPHHTYKLTEAGLRHLGDNYDDLALVLWRELQGIEEPDVRNRIAARICDALVQQYERDVQGESLNERVAQLRSALNQRGFDVEIDSSGRLPILRENNCPYLDLASSDSTICEMEQAVFERVLKSRMTLTQCCLDGYNCCEFETASERQSSTEWAHD